MIVLEKPEYHEDSYTRAAVPDLIQDLRRTDASQRIQGFIPKTPPPYVLVLQIGLVNNDTKMRITHHTRITT